MILLIALVRTINSSSYWCGMEWSSSCYEHREMRLLDARRGEDKLNKTYQGAVFTDHQRRRTKKKGLDRDGLVCAVRALQAQDRTGKHNRTSNSPAAATARHVSLFR